MEAKDLNSLIEEMIENEYQLLNFVKLNKKSKIFIAGHKGMVGSAILNYLKKKGYKNLITESKSKLNLLSQKDTQNFISRINPDFIIIAAAKVGGILANQKYKANFYL